MPSVHLWPSLAGTVVLLLAIAVLVRGLIRTRTAPAPVRPRDARDGTAADRIEQDLRALDWLHRQGRISGGEYRRERERILRD